jgi:hypothetical protein
MAQRRQKAPLNILDAFFDFGLGFGRLLHMVRVVKRHACA